MAVALAPALFDQVEEALKDVMDPELGVNIVDLGLIYDVDQEEDGKVKVNMTLTSPSCPAGPQIIQQALTRGSVAYSLNGTVAVDAGVLGQPTFGPMQLIEGSVSTAR